MSLTEQSVGGGAWGEYTWTPPSSSHSSGPVDSGPVDSAFGGSGSGALDAAWVLVLGVESPTLPVWQVSDADLSAEVEALERAISLARARQARLLVEWEQRQPSSASGLGVAEQVHLRHHVALRRARAQMLEATDLADHPAVLAEVEAGRVGYEQAVAAVAGLKALPDDLDPEQRSQAEEHVVEHMRGFDPVEIRRLVRGVVAIVAPELTDQREAEFLERQERQARRDRFFTWSSNGCGSMVFRGQLPNAEAEQLIVALRALSQTPRGADRGTGGLPRHLGVPTMQAGSSLPTRNQRHADALVRLVGLAGQSTDMSLLGGSRPRVHVSVSLEQLRTGLGAGAFDHTGEQLSPAACRRLACDAEIIPVVLGGAGEPLDVGRAHRLVTGPLRTALQLRDGRCVFAGCDRPPRECDAHHLVPWWAGGRTTLENLVLVCPHHHGVVEPAREPDADPAMRWRIRIAADGVPETIPPRRVDPAQTPIRHARHRLRAPEPSLPQEVNDAEPPESIPLESMPLESMAALLAS